MSVRTLWERRYSQDRRHGPRAEDAHRWLRPESRYHPPDPELEGVGNPASRGKAAFGASHQTQGRFASTAA